MEKNGNRPQRISPDQIDEAVEEALVRVDEANELSQDDLDKANGGTVDLRQTAGFISK